MSCEQCPYRLVLGKVAWGLKGWSRKSSTFDEGFGDFCDTVWSEAASLKSPSPTPPRSSQAEGGVLTPLRRRKRSHRRSCHRRTRWHVITDLSLYSNGEVGVTFQSGEVQKAVTLVPHLGSMFRALLSEKGTTPPRDDGLPFKNKRALANAVAEIQGEPIDAADPSHTVVKYVHKLRRALFDTLADDGVIEKGPAGAGYRLAVRRSALPIPTFVR